MRSIISTSLLFFIVLCYGQRLQTPSLSPLAQLSQDLGLTTVKLEYSRPSAKGRSIFGSLVPYDKIWRTGANASTKITLTEAATIGGNSIDAGTYALYTIPGKTSWTIIVHSNTKLRSLAGDGYKPEKDVFRFQVAPIQGEHYIETFTIQFSSLKTNACDVQLSWENTIINIPISVDVDSKIDAQMADFLKNPDSIPHRTYFEVAQYYLNNDRDLNEAIKFIDSGLEKSPENFRYGLLKSKIQFAQGDKKAALKTVNKANEWATKANNANYIEQTDLYRKWLVNKK